MMPIRRYQRRCRPRGFTMIELLVALLAGLIVAIAVVGLSKQATITFHEEARISAAESSVRIAMDRLRSDLQRVGYMATGNITTDPTIAAAPGTLNTAAIPSTYVAMKRLAGVRLYNKSASAASAAATTSNSLAPDMIEFAGNFTSTDEYSVSKIEAAGNGCDRIWLQEDSPAMWRVRAVGAGSAPTVLRNIFQPTPSGNTSQFIIRFTDDTNHHQYVPTCGVAAAAGFSGTAPYVDVVPGILQSSKQTQTVGGSRELGGLGQTINPVQIVRWDIAAAAVSGLNPGSDATKFDLVRTFVDALGNPVAATSEVIAEYAVDLKFAFSVDGTTVAVDPQSSATSTITYFNFDDDANATYAADVSTASTSVPQRIRSIRARLVVRAANPDRDVSIALAPANINSQKFLYRYLVRTGAYARTRTMTTEITLPNQARNYF